MTLLRLGVAVCLGALLVPGFAKAPGYEGGPETATLLSRSVEERLARDFASPDVSYLVYDVSTDSFIAWRWVHSDEPVPVGSLVKPFTALAYAESHGYQYPEHVCQGGNSCWYPKGHGQLGIVRAVALSCNAYFAELGAHTGAAEVRAVAQRFGLRGPDGNASPEALAGRFGQWQESPQALVRAYAVLLERRLQPGIREIVAGMAESARTGTAEGIASQRLPESFLAKTGTAPCIHKERSSGDGFVIVARPADLPRYLLLVRLHGKTGAQTAVLAGRMLRDLEP